MSWMNFINLTRMSRKQTSKSKSYFNGTIASKRTRKLRHDLKSLWQLVPTSFSIRIYLKDLKFNPNMLNKRMQFVAE